MNILSIRSRISSKLKNSKPKSENISKNPPRPAKTPVINFCMKDLFDNFSSENALNNPEKSSKTTAKGMSNFPKNLPTFKPSCKPLNIIFKGPFTINFKNSGIGFNSFSMKRRGPFPFSMMLRTLPNLEKNSPIDLKIPKNLD